MPSMDLRSLEGRPLLDESCPLPLERPFRADEAAREGVNRAQLNWLTTNGYLRRMVKGVYVATQAGDSTLLRCQALSLVVPDDCVVCDRHAGWLLGAEMVLAPNEHLELRPISIYRPSGRGRLRNDLVDSGERNLSDGDVMEINGLRVTTPLRTAWDLGRVRYTDQAIAGLDALFRLEAFTRAEFLAGIERFRRMRFVTVLRAIGPLADGRAASPGESVLRLRWIEAGLPTPQPQLEVWKDGTLLAMLDIATAEIRYAAEFDGKEWHSSPAQREHDSRRRETVEDQGWMVDVFVASDVWGRQQNAEARLRAGAIGARQRLGGRVA